MKQSTTEGTEIFYSDIKMHQHSRFTEEKTTDSIQLPALTFNGELRKIKANILTDNNEIEQMSFVN